MALVAGVDGCPGGWVVALAERHAVTWRFAACARDLLDLGAEAVAVDIPIGFPASGARACELVARERLGTARSSVFLTPPRPVVETASYSEANARCRELTGKGLSKQAWALFPRMRDVDAVAGDSRLVEVHPELSFRALAPGTSFESKHRARGLAQRMHALDRVVDVVEALTRVPAPARLDDALDALAAAWSAGRWLRGVADVLPGDPPPYDDRGRPMQMVV